MTLHNNRYITINDTDKARLTQQIRNLGDAAEKASKIQALANFGRLYNDEFSQQVTRSIGMSNRG